MTGRKRGTKGAKSAALDRGLKAMFRTLEQRPVPPDIESVVDQLEAAPRPAKPKP